MFSLDSSHPYGFQSNGLDINLLSSVKRLKMSVKVVLFDSRLTGWCGPYLDRIHRHLEIVYTVGQTEDSIGHDEENDYRSLGKS